jgi:hypothetical protein
MRIPRSILVSFVSILFVVGSVVLLGNLSTAQAGDDSDLKAVYPNKIARSINQACPAGSVKLFRVKIAVPKGEKIIRAREFMLPLLNGDVLVAKAERVSSRLVEYTLVPRPERRQARINTFNLKATLAYVEYTSHTIAVHIGPMCIEQPDVME